MTAVRIVRRYPPLLAVEVRLAVHSNAEVVVAQSEVFCWQDPALCFPAISSLLRDLKL